MHEAERLQTDLRRAGIEPYGWIINASLAAAQSTHPTLRARGHTEHTHIDHVLRTSTSHTWLVGWHPQPPEGIDALRELAAGATAGAH